MADKGLAQKLQIKPGRSVLLVKAPSDYESSLDDLPDGVTVSKEFKGPVDIIQVFVENRQELEDQLAKLKPLLAPKGIVWVTYHKGTSKVKTDINRDSIWAYAKTIGMEAVAQISIDDDWSAMRLKVVA